MPTVLDGIRVAAFTHFAAGPIAAQYLGAFGADVIKVESPQQDVNRYALRHPDGLLQGISPYFLVTNRNQRCLGLDLGPVADVAGNRASTSRIQRDSRWQSNWLRPPTSCSRTIDLASWKDLASDIPTPKRSSRTSSIARFRPTILKGLGEAGPARIYCCRH